MKDNNDLPAVESTDSSVISYKINSTKFQERIDAFRAMPAPAVLTEELSAACACLERCINDGDMRTAAVWATCINKLSRSHLRAGVLANELLSKRVIASLAEAILRVVNDEFHGLPGYEDRYLRAAERISHAIEAAENGPADVPGERE